VTLTFSQPVTPSSIKIGDKEASFVRQSAASATVEIKVPEDTRLGQQNIVVTVNDSAASPLTSSIVVLPTVTGLKANKEPGTPVQSRRGAVAGGEIVIQFSDRLPAGLSPSQLTVTIGNRGATILDMQNDYLIVRVPYKFNQEEKPYPVRVALKGEALQRQPTLNVIYASSMYFAASLVVLILILLVYALYKVFYKIPAGQERYTFLTMSLLEPENQTYSLSRAQFLGWLIVIVWSYLFLFFAYGLIENLWAFPDIGNAVYVFLISLGTLVASLGTSKVMGAKGAGEVHPSPADLVTHGGILALDRVQQLIWTLIALGIFLRITVTTYATVRALPEIPEQLLVLMGLSSMGYLGGKLVRRAGPIIKKVSASAETGSGITLKIEGEHFSKDAFVWVDGVKVDQVTPGADDPDAKGFTNELTIQLVWSKADWYAKDHALTVVNDDTQRADWHTGPEIVEVTHGEPRAGKAPLTIKGARLTKGATITVAGAPGVIPVQSDSDPNIFTMEVDPTWLQASHELVVTMNGQTSAFTFKPSS